MKNSIYNKNEVPRIQDGLADTGYYDFDDYNHPAGNLNPVSEEEKDTMLRERSTLYKGYDGEYVDNKLELLPKFTKPSSLRAEPLVTITVPCGIHPVTLIKPEAMNHAWIILDKNVVEKIREFPYKFKQNTIAYGEFFRLENNDSFTLQGVEYFEGWRVLREAEINGTVYQRPDVPEYIIELVM